MALLEALMVRRRIRRAQPVGRTMIREISFLDEYLRHVKTLCLQGSSVYKIGFLLDVYTYSFLNPSL